jgi:type II secretory pathway pseudopilin PulG
MKKELKMLSRSGFSILETFIVVAIMGVLFSVIIGTMNASRDRFQDAGSQIDRMQNARKGVDRIAWELRIVDPSWEVNSIEYSIAINPDGDQLDFYLPIINSTTNEVESLHAVRYHIGGLNDAQLLRTEGLSTVVITNDIDNNFGMEPLFAFNNTDNTIVDIRIPIIKNNSLFILTSQANLRNRDVQLNGGVTIEEIP